MQRIPLALPHRPKVLLLLGASANWSFLTEHELAVNCKDSEFGEADMSCGLARSCDSCAHELWFCGLKSGHEVGLGDSSSLRPC